MDNLSPTLRWYLAIVYTCGSIVTGISFYLNPTLSGDNSAFWVFMGLIVAVNSVPARYTFTKTMLITTTVDVAAAWVLSPIHVILIIFVGHIVHARGRKAWYKVFFNIAAHTISIGTTAFIFSYIIKSPTPISPINAIIILITCTLYITSSVFFLSTVSALSDSETPHTFDKFKYHVLDSFSYIDIVLFVYGVVLGNLWFMSPFLFAFGVLAVFAMQWALRLNTDLIKLSEKQQHVQEAMTSLLVAEDVSQQLNLLLRQLTDVFAIERVRIVLFGINADDEPLIVTSPTAVDLEQICTKTDLLRQLNTEHEMRRIDRDPAYAAYCTMPTFLVPLATSNEVIGAMLFAMPRTALETIESRLLITYTTQAALAVVQSQLIDRIQASQEQLVRSERLAAVGTLAASLAHEFNNILAIISSTAELAAMKPECETHRKSLSLIGMTAKRGGSITRGLLTFTRQIEPYRELANLHDAIEPVLAMLKTRFRDTKVHVVRDFGTVPPLVCDIGLLSQVVLNLVTNALDAMYPTGGTLTIKLWAEDNTIKLRISDTGTGIPDEIRSTLFEPFTTSKQHAEEGILGGNGLGLAITHGIVTSHDGTIDVDSTPGQGTAITVTLPASKSELPESVQVLPVPGLERLRVMVVDDEPLIAMALAQIVEMENHHVTWLSDPELALVHISQAPPDILMADMHMPRLDGLTLIQFAKEFAPAMQQIVVTGQIQAHQRSEVRTLGVEVVHKPFSVADIRAALGRAALALGAGESHAAPVHPGRSEELEIAPTISQQELNPAIRSTVRHQLMNHVTALEGLVPILQQTLYGQPAAPSSLDGPTLLRHMARVVGALGVVVRAQRLLYLSDHDNKPIVLPVAPVTLYHQLIEAKNRVSAGFLPHEQITIEVDCPPDLEIDGNAMSLLTAITAAIYNAAEAIARHASGDEQNITVSAHDQGEIVALRVADTGPGFAPQLLEQIAATIDQGQGEQFIGSLQPRHGTGLGIALMVRVARLHAGTIAFGNHAERRGAWVELLLPKKAMLEAAQLSPSANIVLERVPG